MKDESEKPGLLPVPKVPIFVRGAVVAVAIGSAVVGCGTQVQPSDAGTDGGPTAFDAGIAPWDSGPTAFDAGIDAGIAPRDSGPAALDAGEDSGPTAFDAGIGSGDSGAP